jgi:uncharacterized protein
MNLLPSETRVLGCLLEKQSTTPDMYPLTLNALRLACNQSTNRDPVVDYDDEVLRDALHRLERRGFTRLASGRGSRAPKYRHLLAEALPMSSDERAIVCVLMLRGAQTPGELKQRAERMHPFGELHAVHDTLAQLIDRGLVERLERRPGQKEERYRQLLEDPDSGEEVGATGTDASLTGSGLTGAGLTAAGVGIAGHGMSEAAHGVSPTGPSMNEKDSVARARVEDLEERVATLEQAVAELREAVRS